MERADLTRALGDFARAASELIAALSDAPPAARHNLTSHAVDIQNHCESFRDAYARAHLAHRGEWERWFSLSEDEKRLRREFDSLRRALTTNPDTITCINAIKALVFSGRAYQDAVYRAFLYLRSERPARNSSMSQGVQERKPLRLILDRRCRGYVVWFTAWRMLRDRLKAGIDLAPYSEPDRLLFHEINTNETGLRLDLSPQAGLGAEDITELLVQSACAALAVAEEGAASLRSQ